MGYSFDYSRESGKDVDSFITEQSKKGKLLSKYKNIVIFALGTYIGKNVVIQYGGVLCNDPLNKAELTVKLPSGYCIFPASKFAKCCDITLEGESIESY